jgi:hypothetical protein
MRTCPDCGTRLVSRGIVEATRQDLPASRALWECERGRHRFAAWTDHPADLVAWDGEWWPRGGVRADLEADRPPHWS